MSSIITNEICEAFREGDESAFDKIFLAYNKKVRIFISKIVHSTDDAEEICQEVFVKLWEKRDSITSTQRVSSYIFSMAKNSSIDFLRRKKIHESYIQNEMHVRDQDVHDDEVSDEYVKFLYDLICSKLPKKQRVIFQLSYEQGLSNEEIAEVLNISKKTVDNSLSVSRGIFRKVVFIYMLLAPLHGLTAKIF